MAVLADTQPVPLRQDEDGVVRVGGTRVTLETVLAAYAQGSTPEEIARDYSALETADIYGAIAYYLRHKEEVEEYLLRSRQLEEEACREVERRFPREGVRERLESRRG